MCILPIFFKFGLKICIVFTHSNAINKNINKFIHISKDNGVFCDMDIFTKVFKFKSLIKTLSYFLAKNSFILSKILYINSQHYKNILYNDNRLL